MPDLNKPRQAIDQIDEAMKVLFLKRLDVVKEVIAYKKEFGIPIFDQTREQDMLRRNLEGIDDAVKPYYKAFLESMLVISKQFQKDQL